MRTIKAWHFLPQDGRLRYGTNEKVKVGKTISVDGPVELCANGLHGSRNILDALRYAPGSIICEVAIWGGVKEQDDKLAGLNRKVIRMADAKNTILEFACKCAEHALKRHWKSDDNRPYEAIAAVRKHILGEQADLRSAANAAVHAAHAAVHAADVADSADAAYAANVAAYAADAAHAAYAANVAAYAAARNAQERLLRIMINQLLEGEK